MATTVKVEGLRELEKALGELPRATGKNVLRRVLRTAGEPMVRDAKALVPVASGKLRDSIAVATQLSKRQRALYKKMFADDKASVEMFVGVAALPHAHLQEFGTSRHGPQPFMRPAWDANKNGMLDSIKDELGVEIAKAAKRLAAKQARLAAKGG